MLEIEKRIVTLITEAERSTIEEFIKRDNKMSAERRNAIKDIPEEDPVIDVAYHQKKWCEYNEIYTSQKAEYLRMNSIIQEITDLATKRYAENWVTPDELYTKAKEIIDTFSLELDKDLFTMLGCTSPVGKLPDLEMPFPFIRMVFPDKDNDEKYISDIYKTFITHYELENLAAVCNLKNWDTTPITDTLKAKSISLYENYKESDNVFPDISNEVGLVEFDQEPENGSLVSLGSRHVSITNSKYQFALSTRENSHAYIIPLRTDFSSAFKDIDGTLMFDEEAKLSPEELTDPIEADLLRDVFTTIYKKALNSPRAEAKINWQEFCREMGVRHSKVDGDKRNDIFQKLLDAEKFAGFIDGQYAAVLRISNFDPETQILTFSAPYMEKVIEAIAENSQITTKKRTYLNPSYSFLVHTNIGKERNKDAVEITEAILALMFQRGSKPDAELKQNEKKRYKDPTKVTATIKFSTLIDYIPNLSKRLENAKDTSNKNKILKNSFSKAYDLLKTKTDAYKYFVDLKIDEIIPTTSTIDSNLIITHKGSNGDYKSGI